MGANLRQIVLILYLIHPITEKIGAILFKISAKLHGPQTEGEKVLIF